MATGLKAGALAIGVALAYSVSQAMQFEEQMRNVNSISKLSEGAFQNLSDRVLELSTQVPQSATTLAEGLYDIASSGFQGADGLKVLHASALAATAGMSDTATAAKGITAVLNAYGLSARDAGYVSDTLFQTVNLGVITFSELSTQLGDVVGIAAAAHVSIGEVGAAIAAMTLAGISGAESTTSLNRVIQSIIDPSDELAGLFHQMGYESGYSALQQLGLHGVMEKIRISTGGNVEALLKLFPEIRAARGAFALMANEGQNYAKTFDQIADKTKVAGATQSAFNEQMKSFSNQLRLAWNQIQAAAIDLGRAIIPILNDVLDAIFDIGSEAADVVGAAIEELSPAFESLGTALENIIDIAGQVIDVLAPIGKVLLGLGVAAAAEALGLVADALAEITGAVADSPTAVKLLAAALLALAINAQLASGSLLAMAASSVVGFFTTVGSAVTTLALSLAAFAESAYLAGGALGVLKAAGAGLGQGLMTALSSPLVGIGLLSLGIVGLVSAFQRADAEAQQFVSHIKETSGFNPRAIETYANTLGNLRTSLKETNANLEDSRNSFEDLAFSTVDAFVDIGDGTLDYAARSKALAAEIDNLTSKLGTMQSGLNQVWRALHPEVGQGFETFDMLDTRMQHLIQIAQQAGIDISGPIKTWKKDLTEAALAADNLGPGLAVAHQSLKTVGDAASTAADQLKAYKDAMDAVIGTVLSAFEANTKWGESLEKAAASVAKAGTDMDIHTEAGRANREALSGAADAALKHAQAVADETGSIDEANKTLQTHVTELDDVMRNAGLTEDQITEMNKALGLTPENLEILLALNGADTANAMLDTLNAKAHDLATQKYIDISVSRYTQDADEHLKGMQVVVKDITGETHTVTVDANTVDADKDLAGFQVLVQDATGTHEMTIDANTADADLTLSGFQTKLTDITGKEWVISTSVPGLSDIRSDLEGTQITVQDLEGHPHEITVETVGMNEDVIPTLEGIQVRVLDLEGKPHIITLDANPDPATGKTAEMEAYIQGVMLKQYLATLDANPEPATSKGSALDAYLSSLGPYIPPVDADTTKAIEEGAALDRFLASLGPYTSEVTAHANDGGAEEFLNNLARDRTAAITAQIRAVYGVAEGGVFEGAQPIIKAAKGVEVHTAKVYGAMWPGRFFAEPETGGEAYIPLALAKRARSLDVLRNVAAQFGYGLMPGQFFKAFQSLPLQQPQAMAMQKTVNVNTVLDFSGPVFGEQGLRAAVDDLMSRRDRDTEMALARDRSAF